MISFVIGISGITGAGKTTLALALHAFLSDVKNADTFNGIHINEVILMHQDRYFYPRDSPHHIWIPEINFINRELLSAMNMDKFAEDVNETIQRLTTANVTSSSSKQNERISVNILIIEGFLIYNDERINRFCQLRFQLYLTFDVGVARRLTRTFKHINPKPEWYFEHFIWPSYHKHLNEVPNKADLVYLNGEQCVEDIYKQAFSTITTFLINQIEGANRKDNIRTNGDDRIQMS